MENYSGQSTLKGSLASLLFFFSSSATHSFAFSRELLKIFRLKTFFGVPIKIQLIKCGLLLNWYCYWIVIVEDPGTMLRTCELQIKRFPSLCLLCFQKKSNLFNERKSTQDKKAAHSLLLNSYKTLISIRNNPINSFYYPSSTSE